MELPLLLCAAFAAGLIDAVAGGGGLIQVPALFAVFPREWPAVLFGTNKLAAVAGTLTSAWRYSRQVVLDRRILWPAILAAIIGAYAGAHSVAALPVAAVRPIVLLLLVAVTIYTWQRPELGATSGPLPNHLAWRAGLIGGGIGFYDGFFGPGTGSFLIFAGIRLLHLDFLHASATAKLINVATNLAALSYFLPHGQVLWLTAALMALANIAGSITGSHLALKHGNRLIRKVFLAVSMVLMLKIGWDTVRLF